MYAPEIQVGSVIPMLAGAYAARDFGFEPWTAAALVALAFAIPETLANLALRWPTNVLSPLALIVRDWVFAVIWIDGWLGDDFVWLGNSMTVREGNEPADRAA
jgi:ceramide glucosyltransferase